jgi:hypothetical protein
LPHGAERIAYHARREVGRDEGDEDERSEVGGQRTDYRWLKELNVEQQNKEPQNDEVITSIFEIPCSTFCGSNRW